MLLERCNKSIRRVKCCRCVCVLVLAQQCWFLSVCHFFFCRDMVKTTWDKKFFDRSKIPIGALELCSSHDVSTGKPPSGIGGYSPRTQMFPQVKFLNWDPVPLHHLLPLSSPPSDLYKWKRSMRIMDTYTFPLASIAPQCGKEGKTAPRPVVRTRATRRRETPVTIVPQY